MPGRFLFALAGNNREGEKSAKKTEDFAANGRESTRIRLGENAKTGMIDLRLSAFVCG